jgi:hypothetical protein
MIYQQNKQTLYVVVRGEGVTSGGNVEKTTDKSPKEEAEETKQETSKNKKTSNRVKMITATHAIATIYGIGVAGYNYAMGDIAGTTGDKNFGDIVKRNSETSKDVVDVLIATTMGAYYGSRGGVVAGFVTAGLSFATATASKVNKYLVRDREYNIETFKMDNEINYVRSRANINLTNGRLR